MSALQQKVATNLVKGAVKGAVNGAVAGSATTGTHVTKTTHSTTTHGAPGVAISHGAVQGAIHGHANAGHSTHTLTTGHSVHNSGRQATYIGNALALDDIHHAGERRVTTFAMGKERVDSSFQVKPVKTSKKISDISHVKLPKGSVAIGQIDLGNKVIIEEPKEVIKYVERMVEVEEVVYQPKITQEIIERDVPVYYDEEVEEDVEVEQIVYQDQIVEEFIDQVITIEKPIARTVERKIPVTLTIPRIIEKEVQKIIEVPSGEIVHKEVKIHKEKINHKRRFVEKPVPIVIAHEIHPIVGHDPNIVREVEVLDHYPVITPVDVHIAKPANIKVRAHGHAQVTHRVVTVPAAHYNTLLKKLNPELHEDLPLFMEDGVIPMLNQELSFLYPPADAEIRGFNSFKPAFHSVLEHDAHTGNLTDVHHHAEHHEVHVEHSKNYGTHHEAHHTEVHGAHAAHGHDAHAHGGAHASHGHDAHAHGGAHAAHGHDAHAHGGSTAYHGHDANGYGSTTYGHGSTTHGSTGYGHDAHGHGSAAYGYNESTAYGTSAHGGHSGGAHGHGPMGAHPAHLPPTFV